MALLTIYSVQQYARHFVLEYNIYICMPASQVRSFNVRSSKEESRLKQQKRQIQLLSKQKKRLQTSISAAKKEAVQLRMQVRCAPLAILIYVISYP